MQWNQSYSRFINSNSTHDKCFCFCRRKCCMFVVATISLYLFPSSCWWCAHLREIFTTWLSAWFPGAQMAVHYTRLTPLLNFLLAHTAVCTAELEIVLLVTSATKEVFWGTTWECSLFADLQMAVHYTRVTLCSTFCLHTERSCSCVLCTLCNCELCDMPWQ